MVGVNHLYACCGCHDGPKIFQTQPTCVMCHHAACGSCMWWTDKEDISLAETEQTSQSPVSQGQDHPWAATGYDPAGDKLEDPSVQHQDKPSLDNPARSDDSRAQDKIGRAHV